MKLVADINIPYLKGALDSYFKRVVLLPAKEITSDIVRDADALLVRTRTICNADLLEGSTVKFIGSATIGFDHIDSKYCNSRDIEWVNAPGCNSGGVQQWVASALVYISKVKRIDLNGKVLGVVGVGNVGKKVVEVGKALGMKVICCDPPRKRDENLLDFVDITTIAQQSDFVTFHVPLTNSGLDSTYHMVNSELLNSFKNGVVFLNSSRGEVVDTNSLIDSINGKKFSAVALDVWENEPTISHELLNLVDIATPHIAGYSLEGKVNGTSMVIDSMSRFFNLGIHPWTPKPNPTEVKEILQNPINLIDVIERISQIKVDDSQLRKMPDKFEQIRSDYNLRRDFTGYSISECNEDLASLLDSLGFKTQ